MAKFGFFDYTKPGPGVDKNAPKKHAFFEFFELWFNNIWSLISVNITFFLLNLFIIPTGLASAGMANVTRSIVRGKHSFGVSDFWDTVKKNWKQALPAGIINTIFTVILVFGIYFYYTSAGAFSIIGTGVLLSVFIVFAIMKYYIWLILITFKLPLKKIYKNSLLLVFINFKKNLVIGFSSILYYVVMGLIFWALPKSIVLILLILITIMFFTGLKQLLVLYCVFPAVEKTMIIPYYKEHPDADIEKRRSLGLIDEDDSDIVFNDNRLLKSEEE